MKLQELGLKSKPATKYVEGGYVKFSTSAQHLFYKTIRVNKTHQGDLCGGLVSSKEMLDQILKAKHIKEVFWS